MDLVDRRTAAGAASDDLNMRELLAERGDSLKVCLEDLRKDSLLVVRERPRVKLHRGSIAVLSCGAYRDTVIGTCVLTAARDERRRTAARAVTGAARAVGPVVRSPA